jgi:DNA-binding SARP family transcriptional activator/Flp pilus assembly protein TadD
MERGAAGGGRRCGVMAVRFRILGPIEARAGDGRLVHLGAEKHRVLLAALLLSANRWVGTPRLVEALWPQRPPRSAPSALRTYVSALRIALRGTPPGADTAVHLVGRNGGYQLRVPAGELDALVFEELAVRGQKLLADNDAAAAADLLRRALDLWRGRPLEDIPADAAFAAELGRLDELRLAALEASVEARLTLGQHADVATELRAAVAAEPLRERLHGLWMLALYRSGQQAEALAAYRTLRDRLVDDLAIEPAPPLQRLQRQILTADPTLDPPPAPGRAVTTAPVPRQLPPDVPAFTGRDAELARLESLAADPRDQGSPAVATIDGVPGVGKSALALHAAHHLADRYPDGQLYTNLHDTASLTPTRATAGPDTTGAGGAGAGGGGVMAVLRAFLWALGEPSGDVGTVAEATARYRALTAGRRLLVVLDNAVDAAQVQPLVPASAGSAVLVTSRRILSTMDSDVAVHLDALPPNESCTLLGRLVGPDRVAADPPAAAELVRLCGQLPLALRIAGARLAARPGWPVRALADRLADAQRRLDELSAGDLGVRTSFEVSLQALRTGTDPADRAAAAAFPLLSLLPGPDFGLPAATALLTPPTEAPPAGVSPVGAARGKILDAEVVLERLVDAQLVASPAAGRYRLHDLLRLFAEGCAEELEPAGRTAALLRVLAFYRDAARHSLRLLHPGHQRPGDPGRPIADMPFRTLDGALAWLETERANLVAAITHAAQDPAVPPDLPIGTTQALFGFFRVRGHLYDWIQLNETILALAERTGDRSAAGHALREMGVGYERLGEFPAALPPLRRSLAIFRELGDGPGEAASLTSLGSVHHRQGRYPDAMACQRASLVIRRQLRDAGGIAVNLSNLGAAHQRLGAFPEARACYRESLDILQSLGDRHGTAAVLGNIGMVSFRQHRYADAAAEHRRCLDIFRDLNDPLDTARALNNLAAALRELGRHHEAVACHREALGLADRAGDRYLSAECHRELAATWQATGDAHRARTHYQLALTTFTALNVPEADEVTAQLATL